MTATGKWAQPGVPHKGWTCVDVEDLNSPDHVCEMCETQGVRHLHTMEHPDYADGLRVGCVCAGHMERDLVGARKREDAFKASRSRRTRWLTREWRTSRAGNEYLNADGFNVVVYPVSDGFGARIEHQETGWSRMSKRRYATGEHAKLAAFDVMIIAKAAWCPGCRGVEGAKIDLGTSVMSLDLRKWRFKLHGAGYEMVSPLWLYPELNCSSCVDDVEDQSGAEQLAYCVDVIQRRHPKWWDADAVAINWFACGEGIFETAPNDDRDCKNFLTLFTPPVDAKTGEPLNWWRLPVRNTRFPAFAEALGWLPSPFQEFAPLRSIVSNATVHAFTEAELEQWLDPERLMFRPRPEARAAP